MPPKALLLSAIFSQVVKRHRERLGLSKAALAERSGLHQTYIGLLEKSARSPNLETARAIAEALKIPLSQLIKQAEDSCRIAEVTSDNAECRKADERASE
jgi:transcriptional regulator with XRE-family HTH domain